jgi:hypothetical protein
VGDSLVRYVSFFFLFFISIGRAYTKLELSRLSIEILSYLVLKRKLILKAALKASSLKEIVLGASNLKGY